MTELYPCRCGGKANLEAYRIGTSAYVICEQCGIHTQSIGASPIYNASEQAIELWNRVMKPELQPTYLSDYSTAALVTELKGRDGVRAAALTGGQRLDPDFEALFIGLGEPKKEDSK
jgi:hypothetical protein